MTCIEWPKETLNPPYPWYLYPPCKAACPAGLDIRSYIDLAAHGHYEKALEVIEDKIPFPATIGRVCPHPCETKCNRREFDQSIAINGLKRFIADTVYERSRRGDNPCAKDERRPRGSYWSRTGRPDGGRQPRADQDTVLRSLRRCPWLVAC